LSFLHAHTNFAKIIGSRVYQAISPAELSFMDPPQDLLVLPQHTLNPIVYSQHKNISFSIALKKECPYHWVLVRTQIRKFTLNIWKY